tara:strand:+ start:2177 stop:5701 length:3525 start_codon:yes stop_codon:yes gene_type:complete
MGDTTKNSLSTLLSQFIRLNRNAIETFERINEAVTTNKETVNVDIFDDDNNLKRIQVPSFGFLKSEVNRLNSNIANLSGVGGSDASVRLADGSFRKVITSKLKTSARDITDVQSPTRFEYKNNWFFEDFLNPLMYITVDVSGQLPVDTERILTKKYILELDDEAKIKFFNDTFKNRSDINFNDFNQELIEQNIDFILDDDIRDVPPRETQYVGDFDILNIGDSESEELVDGSRVNRRRKTYKLNKLTYTDIESGFADTLSLKVNDSVVINSSPVDTRYIVKEIDSSTNTVVLELVEGYRGLTIGTEKLSIYKEIDSNLDLEIPISFDKHLVVFVKAVDPFSKIPSENWSPGMAFYTNDLVLQSSEDEIVSLDTFYRNEVTDFGLFLLSLAKDGVTPATLALKPNIPSLSKEDLKVVQVNSHITENPAYQELKSLSDTRNKLTSEIKELDSAIKEKKSTINTKQYNSTIERDKDRSELNTLIETRSSGAKLLSSIIEDITAKSKSEDLINAQPKYRVRGFIPLPKSRKSKYTGDQEIVAIEYEYRYVGKDGSANKVEQFSDVASDGNKTIGAQSNWIKAPLIVRKKEQDPTSGAFTWEDQNIEDPEQININQVDISIRQGEGVEVRARALSEAGFPSNPARSEFSETVTLYFPDELIQPNTVAVITEENNKEAQRVKLEEDLAAKGVLKHIDDQFTSNENFFKHSSLNIFSGELTTEQTPISLFDKLKDLTVRLQAIEETLNRIKGELLVKIVDEEGNETIMEKDSLNKQFAGYYKDLVKELDVKKGSIISKTYFITIENTAATPLELVSRIAGDRTLPAFESGNKFGSGTIDPEISTDQYYINRGKYDYVPVVFGNPDTNDVATFDYISNNPYQSGQLRGQFIYGRYRDTAGSEDLYVDLNPDNNVAIATVDDAEYLYVAASTTAGNTTDDFVWNGDYDGSNVPRPTALTSVSTDYNQGEKILLHVDHPILNDGLATPRSAIASSKSISQSKMSKLSSNSTGGKKQMGYYFDSAEGRSVKCSFNEEDQYTLGQASVGSYLFLAPVDKDKLLVGGDDSLSTKEVEFGGNNAIRIPLVFQFRMTDYSGVGNDGEGFVGGDSTGATKDITYAKRMGFDIITFDGKDEERFSFDIEIFAKYRSNKLNLEKIPGRDIGLAISDISRNLGRTTPNIGSIR